MDRRGKWLRAVAVAVALSAPGAVSCSAAGSNDADAPSTSSATTVTSTTASTTTDAPTTTEAPTTTVAATTTLPETAPPATEPALVPGQACALGSHPDCIDPMGEGVGTYLIGGADCMAAFRDSPGLCTDLDGDGYAGYPDAG